MTRKERNDIIKFSEKMNNKDLEDEYYSAVNECLASHCDEMYELGYDICDIIERKNYEKYLNERVDLLGYLCEERGIKLWERGNLDDAKRN